MAALIFLRGLCGYVWVNNSWTGICMQILKNHPVDHKQFPSVICITKISYKIVLWLCTPYNMSWGMIDKEMNLV